MNNNWGVRGGVGWRSTTLENCINWSNFQKIYPKYIQNFRLGSMGRDFRPGPARVQFYYKLSFNFKYLSEIRFTRMLSAFADNFCNKFDNIKEWKIYENHSLVNKVFTNQSFINVFWLSTNDRILLRVSIYKHVKIRLL